MGRGNCGSSSSGGGRSGCGCGGGGSGRRGGGRSGGGYYGGVGGSGYYGGGGGGRRGGRGGENQYQNQYLQGSYHGGGGGDERRGGDRVGGAQGWGNRSQSGYGGQGGACVLCGSCSLRGRMFQEVVIDFLLGTHVPRGGDVSTAFLRFSICFIFYCCIGIIFENIMYSSEPSTPKEQRSLISFPIANSKGVCA